VHAAVMIGNAEHPLRVIYAAIRDGFQAKCIFRPGSSFPLGHGRAAARRRRA
jgi:hypothetical protein